MTPVDTNTVRTGLSMSCIMSYTPFSAGAYHRRCFVPCVPYFRKATSLRSKREKSACFVHQKKLLLFMFLPAGACTHPHC